MIRGAAGNEFDIECKQLEIVKKFFNHLGILMNV